MLAGTVANVTGATVVAAYAIVLSPGEAPEDLRVGELVVGLALYLAVTLVLGDALNRRLSRGVQRTLITGERPDARQRAALVGIPVRAAIITLVSWAGAALLFTLYYELRYDDGLVDAVELGLTILLGGLTCSALVFLLNERPLRDVYALAFREDPPTRAEGIGVGVRLVLSWVLGAGVPMLAIVLSTLAASNEDLPTLRRAVIALVAAGLVAESLITLRAARSVAEPLASLRGALGAVREGRLDSEVAIDDVTEIGLLQAGFNEMVAGLRERARLEDLFGRHVGEEVTRKTLKHGVDLGGERREVSTLFIDLVGSTRLAAERAPEEVVEMLNATFGAVVRSVKRNGGWVNKFEGDAAMCVFGAPLEQDDHAARALCAARTLRAEFQGLAGDHPGLDAGIGVSTGAAVAGNVGTEERYEYTVIGTPVNEAARLTEEAKSRPGRVLASAGSVRGAGEEAEHWRAAGELHLRGLSEPTLAYEPVSDSSAAPAA